MPTRRARLRRRVYRRLPEWIRRNDFEVFTASLGLLSGIPLMLGKYEPYSIEQQLPRLIVMVWGLVLTLGCTLTLIGVIMGARTVFPKRVFWMRVEALGLTALAYFCYLYAICLFGVAFSQGGLAATFILGFGGVCHVRQASIQLELEEYRRTLGLSGKA